MEEVEWSKGERSSEKQEKRRRGEKGASGKEQERLVGQRFLKYFSPVQQDLLRSRSEAQSERLG